MKIISLHNITVNYDDYEAVSQANLTIYDRDFLGIIGPNGGGKTTLIKAILGIIPYHGQIVYAPELLGSHNRKRIGYLPQQNNFDSKFPISVKEVVVSGLQIAKGISGFYRKKDFDKAEELMEMTGIISLSNKQIDEISGGQMQRTLLCRALISDPKLLSLDEPANFVDNQFEKELYEILQKLNQSIAIIMVSHDIGTITSVVKNIVCVNKHVHRHESNIITAEQLANYNCPLQLISHGDIPHTVLEKHS